jgi:hypothetical protein
VPQLRPGLWHWNAAHPDWKPGEPWDQLVSSYAIDDGKRLLLFDPLAVPSEIEARAGAEQAAGGSPDLACLREGERHEAHQFSAGDRLPVGAEVFAGREHNDVVLWFEPGYVSAVCSRASGPRTPAPATTARPCAEVSSGRHRVARA